MGVGFVVFDWLLGAGCEEIKFLFQVYLLADHDDDDDDDADDELKQTFSSLVAVACLPFSTDARTTLISVEI